MKRVLARTKARELSPEEIEGVGGGTVTIITCGVDKVVDTRDGHED